MTSGRTPIRRAALGVTLLALTFGAGCANAPAPSSNGASDGGNEQAEQQSAGRLLPKTSPEGHQLRQVPASQAPAVELAAQPDPDSGWNIHVTTQRFAFTPEQAGGKASPGEGHAHLYLNGEKIARLYSDWYYLSADAVPKGKHILTVQLNANDHTAWAVNGKVVSDTIRLTGTGEPDGHQHGEHSEHETGGQASADVEVDIQITRSTVTPAPGRSRSSRASGSGSA